MATRRNQGQDGNGEESYRVSVTSPELETIKQHISRIETEQIRTSDRTGKLEDRMGQVESALHALKDLPRVQESLRNKLEANTEATHTTKGWVKGLCFTIGVFMPILTGLTIAILVYVLSHLHR